MQFENFDLLLSDPPAVRVLASSAGGAGEPVPLDLDPVTEAARFDRLVQSGYAPEEELKRLGYALFQGLFQRRVAQQFYTSLGSAGGRSAGLRLRLNIDTPALSRLPWELLFSDDKEFLAASSSYALCRYLPVSQPTLPLPLELPLRILLVVSAPQGLPPLNVQAEVDALREALRPMDETGAIDLVVEEDARPATILARLQSEPVHVLHFTGHGDWLDDSGVVYLEGEQNEPLPTNAQAFSEMAAASQTLRLVVLNACSTAAENARSTFSGVAGQMVQKGLPAVIAMRNTIEDQVAISFARHLYSSLAAGEPVDVAVTRARQQLRMERSASPVAFAIPILYLNTPDGTLFEVVDTYQKRLAQAAQQAVRLNEAAQALAEWKSLHDDLHLLYQSIYEMQSPVTTPAEVRAVTGHGRMFLDNLNNRLLPFASDQIRYVGKRYKEENGLRQGEEWAVRTVELGSRLDQALNAQDLSGVPELAGQIRSLFFKHLTLCNDRMVALLADVTSVFTELHESLDHLQQEPVKAGKLNWEAIQGDLTDLESERAVLAEWIALHSLYDRLQLGFAGVASSLPAQGAGFTQAALQENWERLRDTLVRQLLEQAHTVAAVGSAYSVLPDGKLCGEPWAVDVKRFSDGLDALLKDSRGLYSPSIQEAVSSLDRLIKGYYIFIDGKIRREMIVFTGRSTDLQARVAQ